MSDLEVARIDINGFKVPATYHDALLLLIDALTYGEVNMGWSDMVRFMGGTMLDKQTPVGFFLTADQIRDYTKSPSPVEEYGAINFETMFSMHIDDIVEIQSWFNVLKDKVKDQNEDPNTARVDMIEWIRTLLDLRVDYPNPAII